MNTTGLMLWSSDKLKSVVNQGCYYICNQTASFLQYQEKKVYKVKCPAHGQILRKF